MDLTLCSSLSARYKMLKKTVPESITLSDCVSQPVTIVLALTKSTRAISGLVSGTITSHSAVKSFLRQHTRELTLSESFFIFNSIVHPPYTIDI